MTSGVLSIFSVMNILNLSLGEEEYECSEEAAIMTSLFFFLPLFFEGGFDCSSGCFRLIPISLRIYLIYLMSSDC
jgi:hypothetical protein